MKSDSIIIIPTYNEKENIENIIRAVFGLEKFFHILNIQVFRSVMPCINYGKSHIPGINHRVMINVSGHQDIRTGSQRCSHHTLAGPRG